MKLDKQYSITSDELYSSLQKKEPLLLFDLRLLETYSSGHIEGSVHAVCDAKSKETIMPKIPKNVKIILIDEDGSMSSEISSMMRSFGLDAYFLKDGMKGWDKELVKGHPPVTIKPEDLWNKLSDDNVFLLDVRDKDEFSDFQIPGSVNIPLPDVFISENISKIPQDKEIITICPHGNRAMIATFALARNGLQSHVLEGGLAGWSQVLNSKTVAQNPDVIQIEKVGKGCLSHMIISKGEAVVIDPLFPPKKYQEIVQQQNAKIVKILDTHQHADHVSSAQQLSELTGATMFESGHEIWDRNTNLLKDGDEILFGDSKIKVIHTPGHTPGSLCYLIDQKYVFTGDILFIESIGRPDLRDQAEEFANHLYDSLHNKILTLLPETLVFPTHHGVTVKPENGVYSTTIEKAKQHDVLQLSKDEFVKHIVSITVPRPMNYQRIIQINKGTIPLTLADIPDLELGPNRCSIAGT
ncbi:MAG: MBL fold metallo-hydrolase [Nitrosopumilus sp.]|uniref:rhodanese-like domain-containing protein n=1 Tax=Nitrosopumilus sp. TaxID=2024843 RepID=UPI00247BB074|nr:rhodanese-like domain-containing protein [Nitrosopumilus sp.]MCV0392707.1 MBL fold metallo-hydrolase [Nitrosopumilus sp.]